MKIKSALLLILFVAFLAAPTIITITTKDADVSNFFSLNEEENHVKTQQPIFEFQIQKDLSSIATIQFLKQKNIAGYHDINHYNNVFLEISSPPPKPA